VTFLYHVPTLSTDNDIINISDNAANFRRNTTIGLQSTSARFQLSVEQYFGNIPTLLGKAQEYIIISITQRCRPTPIL
jgi:hypothetical protein